MTAISKLRNAAEAALARMPEHAADLTAEQTRQVLHELRVHQIELEMQNEELRRAQVELAASRACYVDLYDFAPVGYLTVNAAGQILQANLTAATLLGAVRGTLVNMPFSKFVFKDDQDSYYLHSKKPVDAGMPQLCELRLLRHDGSSLWARLISTISRDGADGQPVSHVIVSDISADKRAAEALRRDQEELREMNEELMVFNNAAVGRELRMIELKEEINALCAAAGQAPRYQLEPGEEPG